MTGSTAHPVMLSNRSKILRKLRFANGSWIKRQEILDIIEVVGTRPVNETFNSIIGRLRADLMPHGEVIELYDGRVRLIHTAAIKVAQTAESPLTEPAGPVGVRFYGNLRPRYGRA